MAPIKSRRAEAWVIYAASAFLELSTAHEAVREEPLPILDDDDVEGLWWLSDYLRVWLLRGNGLGWSTYVAVKDVDPYEFYSAVLAKAVELNFGRQCVVRFPSTWHDCEVHGATASAMMTRDEFLRIQHAAPDKDKLDRLFEEFIAAK